MCPQPLPDESVATPVAAPKMKTPEPPLLLQDQGQGQRQAKVQGLVVECDHYRTRICILYSKRYYRTLRY